MHLKDRFRTLSATVVEIFITRFELATAELHDLVLRVVLLLAVVTACVMAVFATVMFFGLTIVLAVPDGYRWIPALVCCLAFAATAVAAGFTLRRMARELPAPFAGTRDVLRRDVAAIRPAPAASPAESGESSPAP
jgi:uncharacterized membrane protein YqjE